nr:hypothetical protein [Haliscomenobacter sp.]
MKHFLFALALFSIHQLFAQNTLVRYDKLTSTDWLVTPFSQKAEVIVEGKNIILYNGLVKRVFRIGANLACFDYKNLSNGQQLLRAVKPEAKISVDGLEYNVGGLLGQKENAYLLPEWLDKLELGKEDFVFQSHSVEVIKPSINWKANTWTLNKTQPTGKLLTCKYLAQAPALSGLQVNVHYELYDGLPLIVKWISIENKSTKDLKLNRVVNEVLALVEEESAVVGKPEEMKKQHGIYIETNYAFNNAMRYDISDQTTHWKTDAAYTSQVNYNYETPCLLEIYPEKAPGIVLRPGEVFKSVRTHELLMDSYDRQRRGLMIRKMYRAIAPWTTQNPIFMHLVSKNDQEVRNSVDQCANTGYEAVILSFGSHLNMEDTSATNIQRWKELADYATAKAFCSVVTPCSAPAASATPMTWLTPKLANPAGRFLATRLVLAATGAWDFVIKSRLFLQKPALTSGKTTAPTLETSAPPRPTRVIPDWTTRNGDKWTSKRSCTAG